VSHLIPAHLTALSSRIKVLVLVLESALLPYVLVGELSYDVGFLLPVILSAVHSTPVFI